MVVLFIQREAHPPYRRKGVPLAKNGELITGGGDGLTD